MSEQFNEVVINPEEKLVYATAELESVLPDVAREFDLSQELFTPQDLSTLEKSLQSFISEDGTQIDYSLIPGDGNEMLVMWAPFADTAPTSDAYTLQNFMSHHDQVSKEQADTNSWNQLTKSAITAGFLSRMGLSMPVLTIFSPMPSNAYNKEELSDIRNGDFSPSGRIIKDVVADAQDKLHGPLSETQLDTLHMQGASLGASHITGAASQLSYEGKKQIKSLTAQELIIGPSSLGDLLLRFSIRRTVDEPSSTPTPPANTAIREPLLRREVDQDGDIKAILARQVKGAKMVSQLRGLTRSGDKGTKPIITHQIESLKQLGTQILIPLAENSNITRDTASYLNYNDSIVAVKAIEGQQATHDINEQAALSAILTVANIRKANLKR